MPPTAIITSSIDIFWRTGASSGGRLANNPNLLGIRADEGRDDDGHDRVTDVLAQRLLDLAGQVDASRPAAGRSSTSGVVILPSGRTGTAWTVRDCATRRY
jgi:hypothetical protein